MATSLSSAELEKKIQELQKLKVEVKSKEEKDIKAYRKHTFIALGVVLEEYCGISWEQLDIPAFIAWFKDNREDVVKAWTYEDETDPIEAFRKLREWERDECDPKIKRTIYNCDPAPYVLSLIHI